MGTDVLAVEEERLLELPRCLLEHCPPPQSPVGPAELAGAVVEGEPEEVSHLVILAEVEAAFSHLLGLVFEDLAEVRLGFLKPPLLAIDQTRKPGHRPRRRCRIGVRGRPGQGRGCLINAPLLEIHPAEIDRAVEAAKRFHRQECFLGLSQLRLAFDQQANPVIVPTLPGRDLPLERGG